MKPKLYVISNWGADYPKSWEFAKHWMRHYRNLGADKITILLHTKKKNSESYVKMYDFLLELGVDEIIAWVGAFRERRRAKIINHSILPKIFENDEVENWVMVPDDDELFKVTENLNETKEFLNYVSETLKQNKIFVTSPRINMKRLDGNVSEKVLSDIPIYDQFPVQENQKPFPYINKKGKQVVNNIQKVVVFNSMFRLFGGQHQVREVNRRRGAANSRFKRESAKEVDGLKVCCHDENIIEVMLNGAFEYKDFKEEKTWPRKGCNRVQN